MKITNENINEALFALAEIEDGVGDEADKFREQFNKITETLRHCRPQQSVYTPACPDCGNVLQPVVQSSTSMLNPDQFDAVKAGDWYCDNCKGTRAVSGFKYFWNKEL